MLRFPGYHYTQKDYRTELNYFRIIFGNSCSVITEPNCFWNELVSVIIANTGLPNPRVYLTEMLWGILFGNFGGGTTKPKLFWN